MTNLTQLSNALRILCMDVVEHAQSGHPGAPMGLSDIATVLWRHYLNHNPHDPQWINRDRFILSNGHASALLYSLLYLTGYDLTINDLKNFRQLHSKTPGHPEYGITPGVEVSTGPLGQGLANGVGFAIGQMMLAEQFNRPDFPLIDHYTYIFVGDGDLMEGIAHEVCSLAGTLELRKLIVLYDDNGISIDGAVKGWFNENVPERFRAYHWHVIENVDGHDMAAIDAALCDAREVIERPVLICCKTQIAYGSENKANTAEAHGTPLGKTEVELVRRKFSWDHEPFIVPEKIKQDFAVDLTAYKNWQELYKKYQHEFPDLAQELQRRLTRELPKNWAQFCDDLLANSQTESGRKLTESIATRKASQMALDHYAPQLPGIVGGSADLTASNLTRWQTATTFERDNPGGNYIYYGVREFGMSAIMNGLAIYGGFIPFGGTFLVFCDYARNAVRMSALMNCQSIFVYTHDSIGLGEDGPTHQPVEHLAMLRATPNLAVWRPATYSETLVAWRYALEHHGPSCLVLSRQNLPFFEVAAEQLANIKKGGYVIYEPAAEITKIIIATGSEVHLAVAAAKEIGQTRVVSMPAPTLFLQQDKNYQEEVLPAKITDRVVVEAAEPTYWYQFVKSPHRVLGLTHFGASAPGKDLFKEYGFTVEEIIKLFA